MAWLEILEILGVMVFILNVVMFCLFSYLVFWVLSLGLLFQAWCFECMLVMIGIKKKGVFFFDFLFVGGIGCCYFVGFNECLKFFVGKVQVKVGCIKGGKWYSFDRLVGVGFVYVVDGINVGIGMFFYI